jgi:hypothetical protein
MIAAFTRLGPFSWQLFETQMSDRFVFLFVMLILLGFLR